MTTIYVNGGAASGGNGSLATPYRTIGEAVAAAADGDTIQVASGIYIEQVSVDGFSGLAINAAPGASVTIAAPTDVTQTATSSSGRAINALVTVTNSTGVTLSGIDIDGLGHGDTVDGSNANYVGIAYRNASGGLTNVDIRGIHDPYPGGVTAGGEPVQSGVQRGVGLQVDNDSLMSFYMHGGSISDFQKNGTVFNYADLDVSGVTVTGGGAQTIIAQNGMQALNSTGAIDGNTITGIGYAGPAAAYSGGILIYDNTDLDITDNVISGSNDDSTDAKVVGIFLFSGQSGGAITGNTISDVDTGIGVYDNATGLVIENNSVSGVDLADPYAAHLDIEANAGSAFSGASASEILMGGPGNDSITGGGGNDTIIGNGGTDTAVYADTLGAADFAYDSLNNEWIVTTASQGTDELSDMEKVTDGAGNTFLLVDPAGSYTTIQAAVDAASDGDIILVAAASYVEDVTVNKAVTIMGANHGLAGTDTGRGAESIVQGTIYVTAASGQVVLDGLEVLNTSNNSTQFIGVRIQNGADVTVQNSLFYSTGPNGSAEDRAINMDTTVSGNITIADNYITGAAAAKYSTASWHRGIWSDGAEASLDITGNTFEHVRSGINADSYNNGTNTISGNTFKSGGTAIAMGLIDTTAITGIHDNTFADVDSDFNLRNETVNGQTLNLDTTSNEAAVYGADTAGVMYVLGTGQTDFLTGTSGPDILDARDITGGPGFADSNPNTLSGLAGDDMLIGSGGSDTLRGGAETDTAIFSSPRASYSFLRHGNVTTISGPDGTDTVNGIELLQFSDGTVGHGQLDCATDFDASGKEDLLWQNTNGMPAVWLMDGGTRTGSATYANPGIAWHEIGAGDFDADGSSDILWQNDNGSGVVWFMNGTTRTGTGAIANPGSAWKMKAAADFNADGYADILWQNTNGQPAVWLMEGATRIGAATLPNPGATWHVKTAADFDGDGKADILWQNDSGAGSIWFMDGTTRTGTAALANPGSAWRMKGAGDFNGDSKADILWQNDNAQPAVWLMDGGTRLAGATFANPGGVWQVKAAQDMDGDGKADIVWQNTNGQPVIWFMDGLTRLSTASLGNPGAAWQIVPQTG